jgi:hypothetical protein
MRADELCFGWLKRIAGMKGRPQSVTYGDARQRAVSLIAAEPWSWTLQMLSALNPTDCSPTGHQSREETSLCRNEVAPQQVSDAENSAVPAVAPDTRQSVPGGWCPTHWLVRRFPTGRW